MGVCAAVACRGARHDEGLVRFMMHAEYIPIQRLPNLRRPCGPVKGIGCKPWGTIPPPPPPGDAPRCPAQGVRAQGAEAPEGRGQQLLQRLPAHGGRRRHSALSAGQPARERRLLRRVQGTRPASGPQIYTNPKFGALNFVRYVLSVATVPGHQISAKAPVIPRGLSVAEGARV